MTSKINYVQDISFEIKYKYLDVQKNNEENIGTGFFIKGNNDKYYFATAKHTFVEISTRETEKWRDVNLEILEKKLNSNIEILKNKKKICDIKSIDFEYEDLVIFHISNCNVNIENDIKIFYQEIFSDNDKFFFYGFCNKYFIENLTSPTPIRGNNYLYRVQDSQSNKIEAIKGCSGAGVFIEKDGNFYLVGILLQRYDNGASYTIFDLPKYLNENPQKSFDICNKKNLNNEIDEESLSHIIKRDGYIEPRTVPIEDLNLHVAVCPVTFEEYDLFCEDMKKEKPNAYNWGRGKRPVIDVTWYDAIKYCDWLSKKSNKNYRLLSYEEWHIIANKNIPKKNYKKSIVFSKKKTAEVSSKKVGLLGLYDFLGNVYEWCDNKKSIEKKLKGISYDDPIYNMNEIMIPVDTYDYRIGFRIGYTKK